MAATGNDGRRRVTRGFSQQMWQEITPLFRRILEHPFVRGLSDGSLTRERFVHYMIQDAHYLALFARALALAAARAPTTAAQVELARASHDAIVVERALHDSFFRDFGVDEATFARSRPSPTCFAYGHYLISTAAGDDWPVALAALVPCFHIYHEVGRVLLAQSRPGNPWQRWIDTYADEAFADQVRRILELADEAHEAAGAPVRARMREAHLTSSRLEWMFWDAAWRCESWPVDL